MVNGGCCFDHRYFLHQLHILSSRVQSHPVIRFLNSKYYYQVFHHLCQYNCCGNCKEGAHLFHLKDHNKGVDLQWLLITIIVSGFIGHPVY